MFIIDTINTYVWGYILMYGLLAVGVLFTLRLGFIQFTHFGEMLRTMRSGGTKDKDGISPFAALSVSLASRIGTGNLAGVAVALTVGGPGAIFWMWVVALIGMATSFAESTLAQLYKTHGPDGTYRGGPAYYISRGLGMPFLGTLFAIFLVLSLGLIVNATQSNSIAVSVESAFSLPTWITGVALSAAVFFVISGGLRSVTRVAEFLVPIMAGAYMLVAVVICVLNADQLPAVLSEIFRGAFGLSEAAGGAAGGMTVAILNGVKRGLFSNEAGMGSAPNIAATATPVPHHPASQGFVQAFGVFVDTILVCTATAAMIILSGAHLGEAQGIAMTQAAATYFMGDFGTYFISIMILLFAFTTVIACFTYAETAMIYMGLDNAAPMMVLKLLLMGVLMWGSVQSVQAVFNAADAAMGIMATINLVAITLLSGTVVKVARDYKMQRAAGITPDFHIADHPDLAKGVDKEIWS